MCNFERQNFRVPHEIIFFNRYNSQIVKFFFLSPICVSRSPWQRNVTRFVRLPWRRSCSRAVRYFFNIEINESTNSEFSLNRTSNRFRYRIWDISISSTPSENWEIKLSITNQNPIRNQMKRHRLRLQTKQYLNGCVYLCRRQTHNRPAARGTPLSKWPPRRHFVSVVPQILGLGRHFERPFLEYEKKNTYFSEYVCECVCYIKYTYTYLGLTCIVLQDWKQSKRKKIALFCTCRLHETHTCVVVVLITKRRLR